jgi:UPF0755 protein
MKSNSSFIIRFFVFASALVLLSGVSCLWWSDTTKSVDPTQTKSIEFTVQQGDGVRVIAAQLFSQKLIRSKTAFFLIVKFMGLERKLEAGNFHLNRAMDAGTVARALTHGSSDIWVQTLEGWRNEEIAVVLARDLGLPESEFLKNAREGYMFPDKYRIPIDATAGAIIKIFSDTFAQKVSSEIEKYSAGVDLTPDQVIILASIVEREGRNDTDRPMIADILQKRMKAGWPLQADATLQYALGYQAQDKTWWKKELSDEDKKINSLYNTYMHLGLPPAAISNPGLSAIRAVLHPSANSYWFYLHDGKGQAHYAVTIEEHAANSTKYLFQ